MKIQELGYVIELTLSEKKDLVRALEELFAMREKYRYPEWANGFDIGTESRVLAILQELRGD